MKKRISASLALLLLLMLAAPALASPNQGASPADIALWQTPAAAPCGEFQKTIAVLGPKAAIPVIQNRLDHSQQGAVIDNTPRLLMMLPTHPYPAHWPAEVIAFLASRDNPTVHDLNHWFDAHGMSIPYLEIGVYDSSGSSSLYFNFGTYWANSPTGYLYSGDFARAIDKYWAWCLSDPRLEIIYPTAP